MNHALAKGDLIYVRNGFKNAKISPNIGSLKSILSDHQLKNDVEWPFDMKKI